MNRVLFMLATAIACTLAAPTATAQQMVYVVRHGEKLDDSKDPVLSPAGEARAVRLANMLASSGVKAIYTTQYRRTVLLAAPTARASPTSASQNAEAEGKDEAKGEAVPTERAGTEARNTEPGTDVAPDAEAMADKSLPAASPAAAMRPPPTWRLPIGAFVRR